ncbi:acyltransferase [Enterococcus sp. LJL120]
MIKIISRIINKINKLVSIQESNKISSIGEKPRILENFSVFGGEFITIGDNFYAGPSCRIEAWGEYKNQKLSPKLQIGNNVKINSKCHIGAINNIVISDDVLLGSNVFITDHAHGNSSRDETEIAPSDRKLYSKGPVIIGEKCWLCENVTILPNVNIGRCSIIAAGAVVTKDVPAYCVVGGNPARIIKYIDVDEKDEINV